MERASLTRILGPLKVATGWSERSESSIVAVNRSSRALTVPVGTLDEPFARDGMSPKRSSDNSRMGSMGF
jgi:hypothetical protein